MKEITAPTGYQLNTEIFEFTVGAPGENDGEILWELEETITNAKRLYGLKIVKKGDNGQPLEGAEFTLYKADGETYVASGVTEADGTLEFSGLPYGTYILKETKAPSGYVPVTDIEPIIINDSTMPGVYTSGHVIDGGTITNDHTRLIVFKVDDKNTTKGLPGTKFKIMSGEQYVQAEHINGVYVFTDFTASAEEATEFETGEGGTFVLDYLPIGDYVLVETEAPEGYIISEKPRDFDISSASQSVTVGNTQIKAELSIVKTDEFGKLLPGVGFTLRTAQGYVQASGDNGSYTCTGLGEEATVLLTGADGRLSVKDLLWGVYTLEEVITPEGLDPVKLDDPITVDAGKHNTTISLPLVNNRKLGDLEFKKTDSKETALAARCLSWSS